MTSPIVVVEYNIKWDEDMKKSKTKLEKNSGWQGLICFLPNGPHPSAGKGFVHPDLILGVQCCIEVI